MGPLKIVRTVSGSTVTTVRVTVVTMGSVRSVVTGKLSAGDRVVLADLHTAVPASNSTTTTRGGPGGTSGLGGGRTSGFGGARG